MMKRIFRSFLVVVLISNILGYVPVKASNPAEVFPYKAIVKIKTFGFDEDYSFSPMASGSGIIINSSGLILTNNHVIEERDTFDKSEKPTAYQICLTEAHDEDPDCLYTADLISKDQDLDVALLQIRPLPGTEPEAEFPYLSLATSDELNVGDAINAIGYPEIGGETVTTSSGIVSGKVEKNGQKWIKTDALTSFGNSGGAVINNRLQVVGIVTAMVGDLFGNSVGYAISVVSLRDWMSSNETKTPQISSLDKELLAFSSEQKTLKNIDTYTSQTPSFSVKKPSDDWQFIYYASNVVVVTKKYITTRDEVPGTVIIIAQKTPYLYDDTAVAAWFKKVRNESFLEKYATVIRDEETTLADQPGRLITYIDEDQERTQLLIPYQNYLLRVIYYYHDKDKGDVRRVLDSIQFQNSSIVDEPTQPKKYEYKGEPKFNLKLTPDWTRLEHNSRTDFLTLENKKNPLMEVGFSVKKIPENVQKLDNEGLLNYIKGKVRESNLDIQDTGVQAEIRASNVNYNLNNNLKNVLKIETVLKQTDGTILFYDTSYHMKMDDVLFSIHVTIHDTDQKKFKKSLNAANKLLKSLKLAKQREL